MEWGYPMFLLFLCGFGVVYLVWPVNQVAAGYGMFAVNAALLLSALSFTQSALVWQKGEWQRSASQGIAAGLWLWVVAGLLEATDLILGNPAYAGMADFLWVTGYIPMFGGLYPRFRDSKNPGKRGSRVIFLILIGCYLAIFYVYLLPHLMNLVRGFPSKAIDVVYVSFNFVLLGMLLTISRELAGLRDALNTAFHVLAAAVVIMIGADIMLGYYTSPDSYIYQLLDIPYFLIYFLLFQAAQEFVRVKRRAVLAP